jgi:hypothetical protein
MTSTITIIEIHVDGVPVSGRVLERSHASIELLLVKPFGAFGLGDGRHIMAAAQRFVNFEAAHGDEVAERILRDLYGLASYLSRNETDLKERWSRFRSQLESQWAVKVRTPSALAERKVELRKRLRGGDITSKSYEQSLKALKAELDEWSLAATDAMDEFWTVCGFQLSMALSGQATKILDPHFEYGAAD